MNGPDARLTPIEIVTLRRVAALLVPGLSPSPAANDLAEYDDLLQQAAIAFGVEFPALRRAIRALPADIDWSMLRQWSIENEDDFELVSTAVTGAYFMSPEVLLSIDYSTKRRSSAPIDQSVNELSDGILDAVLARGPIYREVPGRSSTDDS